MKRTAVVLLLAVVFLTFFRAELVWSGELRNLKIDPQVMKVNTFFTGGRITVTGEIPEGDDLLLSITGPSVKSRYDLIGRYGPFWMTQGQVELENAPNMYILLMPQGDDWSQALSGLGLGLEQLQKQVTITETDAEAQDIFHMFVKLKTTEELYAEVPGAVTYGPADQGYKTFSAVYELPSSTTPGTYDIRAEVIDHVQTVEEQPRQLTVREVGFIQFVHNLAVNRRLTYGVMAVVIALLTGAIMGVLFKGGGSH